MGFLLKCLYVTNALVEFTKYWLDGHRVLVEVFI